MLRDLGPAWTDLFLPDSDPAAAAAAGAAGGPGGPGFDHSLVTELGCRSRSAGAQCAERLC